MSKLIKKYFSNVYSFFSKKDEIISEMNGIVLSQSGLKYFSFQETLSKEIKLYAQNKGIKIDKIVFISSWMADTVAKNESFNFTNYRIRSFSESYFIISRSNGKNIAKVFMGENIEIREE